MPLWKPQPANSQPVGLAYGEEKGHVNAGMLIWYEGAWLASWVMLAAEAPTKPRLDPDRAPALENQYPESREAAC